jgi:hypothetical protein
LTVLQMAVGVVDSVLVTAALRRNGSLHSVVVTTTPATWNAPEQVFFTPDELCKIHAYSMRNQCIPNLLQEGRPQSMLTHLVATSRPLVRTAPNTVVAGLLSGGQTLGL